MLITCVLVRGTTCENCVRVINTRTVQQARHCAKHQDVHSMLRHTHDTNDRTVSRTNKLPRNASSGAQMHGGTHGVADALVLENDARAHAAEEAQGAHGHDLCGAHAASPPHRHERRDRAEENLLDLVYAAQGTYASHLATFESIWRS